MSTKVQKTSEKKSRDGSGGQKAGSAKAATKVKKKTAAAKPQPGKGKKRLRPGELDSLVLTFMREGEKDLPMTPTRIGKGLARSSGAVGNCLERLAKSKKVRLAKKAPRAYDLKGVDSHYE